MGSEKHSIWTFNIWSQTGEFAPSQFKELTTKKLFFCGEVGFLRTFNRGFVDFDGECSLSAEIPALVISPFTEPKVGFRGGDLVERERPKHIATVHKIVKKELRWETDRNLIEQYDLINVLMGAALRARLLCCHAAGRNVDPLKGVLFDHLPADFYERLDRAQGVVKTKTPSREPVTFEMIYSAANAEDPVEGSDKA